DHAQQRSFTSAVRPFDGKRAARFEREIQRAENQTVPAYAGEIPSRNAGHAIARNLRSFRSSLVGFLVSHSQITRTFQPAFLSARIAFLSRSTFRASLGSQ